MQYLQNGIGRALLSQNLESHVQRRMADLGVKRLIPLNSEIRRYIAPAYVPGVHGIMGVDFHTLLRHRKFFGASKDLFRDPQAFSIFKNAIQAHELGHAEQFAQNQAIAHPSSPLIQSEAAYYKHSVAGASRTLYQEADAWRRAANHAPAGSEFTPEWLLAEKQGLASYHQSLRDLHPERMRETLLERMIEARRAKDKYYFSSLKKQYKFHGSPEAMKIWEKQNQIGRKFAKRVLSGKSSTPYPLPEDMSERVFEKFAVGAFHPGGKGKARQKIAEKSVERVEQVIARSGIQTSHLAIGGAILAGTWLLSKAHRHRRGDPLPADQLVKHYSHGGPLGALAAGGLMRMVNRSSHSPGTMAVAAGAGAALGSFIGDRHYAKHGSMGLIGVTAGLTGAAAMAVRAGADRWVDPGINTLRSFLRSNTSSVDQNLGKALSTAKSLHPFFDSVISRAGLKGLLTVAAIPLAHQMVQRVITRKYRKADTFLHSSILGPLTPHPADIPRTDGPRYIPGSKVSGGRLNMDGDVYDHTDRIDLHKL